MKRRKKNVNKFIRDQLIKTGRLVKNEKGIYEESDDFDFSDLKPEPKMFQKPWKNKREMKAYKRLRQMERKEKK